MSKTWRAKRLYTQLLGVEPHFDEAYHVGYKIAGREIGLDPRGHGAGMTGPVGYWHVSDIEGSLRSLLEAGAQMHQDVKDVGDGKLIASIRDVDGNTVGLVQAP